MQKNEHHQIDAKNRSSNKYICIMVLVEGIRNSILVEVQELHERGTMS